MKLPCFFVVSNSGLLFSFEITNEYLFVGLSNSCSPTAMIAPNPKSHAFKPGLIIIEAFCVAAIFGITTRSQIPATIIATVVIYVVNVWLRSK
jgi:hypothetical protein